MWAAGNSLRSACSLRALFVVCSCCFCLCVACSLNFMFLFMPVFRLFDVVLVVVLFVLRSVVLFSLLIGFCVFVVIISSFDVCRIVCLLLIVFCLYRVLWFCYTLCFVCFCDLFLCVLCACHLSCCDVCCVFFVICVCC